MREQRDQPPSFLPVAAALVLIALAIALFALAFAVILWLMGVVAIDGLSRMD